MALNIQKSKPTLQVNLVSLLSAAGPSKAVLQHIPSYAEYDGSNIAFDFLGEAVTLGPIKDVNVFYDKVLSGEELALNVVVSLCQTLAAFLGESGVGEATGTEVENVPDTSATEFGKSAPAFTDINGLLAPGSSPKEFSKVDHPDIRLYDYVPGSSNINYRAVGRADFVLASVRITSNTSASLRVQVLPFQEIDTLTKGWLEKLGFAFKSGKNAAGIHCLYASLHVSVGHDDAGTITDLIAAMLNRIGLTLPLGFDAETLM